MEKIGKIGKNMKKLGKIGKIFENILKRFWKYFEKVLKIFLKRYWKYMLDESKNESWSKIFLGGN